MTEINEDIFFQVKKEILDKLDIILQKVNLQIINYIKPEEDQFNFIELASFEQQITHLFGYLDRLYASLNSSVSFSSIQSYKESAEQYQAENERLTCENNQLKKMIEQFSQSSFDKASIPKVGSSIDLMAQIRQVCNLKFQPLKHRVKALANDLRNLMKHLKKQLKAYKFQMLQTRVEVISRLKDWQHEHSTVKVEKPGLSCNQMDHNRDGEDILQTINHILSIC